MRTLILTEKPSVAEDFARALQCRRREGYFENGEYFITWALGICLRLAMRICLRSGTYTIFLFFPRGLSSGYRRGELIARLILQKAWLKDWSKVYRLDIAQKLYEERKAISYPRRDAEYLSESSIPLVKEILKRLKREDPV